MKSIIFTLALFCISCFSADIDYESYVCFSPAGEDYGPACTALLPIDGTKTSSLKYTVTVVKPDKNRVWCEGKSYYTSDKKETEEEGVWYLLGNGFDTYSYSVPWTMPNNTFPAIRCKSEGANGHLIDYQATLLS